MTLLLGAALYFGSALFMLLVVGIAAWIQEGAPAAFGEWPDGLGHWGGDGSEPGRYIS